MNAEKYTQKALEAVKTAQNMAQENGNQYVTTEHLLYALLDQDGGLIGSLFGKMGVDCDGLLSELDTLIRNLPRISGGSGEVYASPEVGKILNLAEKTAEKLHDEYLSVEHLMLAIFSEGSQSVRQLLSDHGITRSRFSDELAKVKTSPVTSDNPEDSYDALKKYGTDLVERARTKELDPVIGRDTVGVVAKVSAVCAELNINIEDITQSIMQDMFCMIMLVDISACASEPAEIRARFDTLGQEMGMQVTVTRQEVFDAMHKV